MASILIREADANGVKRFKAVPEGQGIRTGHVKGPFHYRPVIVVTGTFAGACTWFPLRCKRQTT